MAALRVRAVTPAAFLIGRSVHSVSDIAVAATDGGVDYVLFGTVFDTASKPNRTVAGVHGLAAAVAAAGPLPVLAIGGVTNDTARQLPASGCAGFAAIGQFADVREDDLAATMTAALAAWDNPR
jgi:thiamine-phosphate diphosphorylase